MFRRIREKFQCLEGKDKNSNVSKDKIKNSNVWQDKIRIPMIERTGKKFNVCKENSTIRMFGRIRKKFQCLEG